MDNLTHTLVGALIGQAGLKRKTGLAMAALMIGANAPDIDVGCFAWLHGVEHLGFRRGITHGPIAWAVLPLLVAGGLWWFDRWQARRGTRPEGRLPVSFGWLFALALLACLTHPALDWLNVYGVRLLEPFSHRWFYGDTLFIVDVWLWLLMGLATWFSLRREKRGGEWRRPAQIALVVVLGYIGLNGAITSATAAMASGQPAIASPLPILSWARQLIEPAGPDRWRIDGRKVGDCKLAPIRIASAGNPEAEAFLFWSRAPFTDRAADGSVILRDARFYDPRARDSFSLALPGVTCEELSEP